MVVVGVDAGGTPVGGRGGRRDAQKVGTFVHRGAQFAQLGGHGSQAVGFLHAPAGNVAQYGGAICVQRHHRQRHGSVGNVVAVEVNGLERPGAAPDLQSVGAAGDACPHGLRGFYKADITLDGVQPYALNIQVIFAVSACCNCAKRYEIASRRGVRFDMDAAR